MIIIRIFKLYKDKYSLPPVNVKIGLDKFIDDKQIINLLSNNDYRSWDIIILDNIIITKYYTIKDINHSDDIFIRETKSFSYYINNFKWNCFKTKKVNINFIKTKDADTIEKYNYKKLVLKY